MVSKDGISVDRGKVYVVADWKRPTIVIEIRSFLGLTGYYKHLLRGSLRLPYP